MRWAIPRPILVHDHRELHVRFVDMHGFDEEEIFAGERTLVGRFGYYNVMSPEKIY